MILLASVGKDGIQETIPAHVPQRHSPTKPLVGTEITAIKVACAISQAGLIALPIVGENGIRKRIPVQIAQRYAVARVRGSAHVAAGNKTPCTIALTHPVDLVIVRKDDIQDTIAIQVPQRHANPDV